MRKLKRMQIIDEKTGDNIVTTYSEFETVENNVLASTALILLERASNTNPNGKNAVVSIKYNNFNLNEADLQFPFTVPEDYERK